MQLSKSEKAAGLYLLSFRLQFTEKEGKGMRMREREEGRRGDIEGSQTRNIVYQSPPTPLSLSLSLHYLSHNFPSLFLCISMAISPSMLPKLLHFIFVNLYGNLYINSSISKNPPIYLSLLSFLISSPICPNPHFFFY